MANMSPLRGYITSYPPRVRQYGNALLTPVYPVQTGPTPRTTKRGTTAINYAEDGFDDEDFDESDGLRRPTGLRSLRREESSGGGGVLPAPQKLGKEARAPVEVQGVFREWMIKRMLRPAYVFHLLKVSIVFVLRSTRSGNPNPSFQCLLANSMVLQMR